MNPTSDLDEMLSVAGTLFILISFCVASYFIFTEGNSTVMLISIPLMIGIFLKLIASMLC